jgi:hypothetical protein
VRHDHDSSKASMKQGGSIGEQSRRPTADRESETDYQQLGSGQHGQLGATGEAEAHDVQANFDASGGTNVTVLATGGSRWRHGVALGHRFTHSRFTKPTHDLSEGKRAAGRHYQHAAERAAAMIVKVKVRLSRHGSRSAARCLISAKTGGGTRVCKGNEQR